MSAGRGARRGARRGSASPATSRRPGRAGGSRRCSTSVSASTRRGSSARGWCATSSAGRCRACTRAARRSRWRAGPGPVDAGRRGGLQPGLPASSGRRRWARRTRPASARCTGSTGPSWSSSTTTPRRCCTTLDVLDGVMRALPATIRDGTGSAACWSPRSTCWRTAGRRRRPGPCWLRRWLRPPAPARTASWRPGTPTSTRRGCGRWPRRCASACGRSPRWWS